jgi:hypothetical protein
VADVAATIRPYTSIDGAVMPRFHRLKVDWATPARLQTSAMLMPAARVFLAGLTHDRAVDAAELHDTLAALRARFVAEHVPAGAAAQVGSVAGRFALIGAAGELARDYGVLPWPEGEALRAAGACFAAWLAERGGAGSGEDTAALAQVRQFLEAHGESRFTLLAPTVPGSEPAPPDIARTINRAGWRRRATGEDGERWEYLILPETWKAEVCKGLDAKRTAELLAGRGLLLGGNVRHRAVLARIPGEGPRRVYVVSGAILGGRCHGGRQWRWLTFARWPASGRRPPRL